MTREEILRYAKKHYPIGTKFKPIFGMRSEATVLYDDYEFYNNTNYTNNLTVSVEEFEGDSSKFSIYEEGKGWAAIIETPKEELKIGEWVIAKSNLPEEQFPIQLTQIKSIFYGDSRWYASCDFKNKNGSIQQLITEWSSSPTFLCRKAQPDEMPKQYDYEVVHCTTQEELDFASKILKTDGTRKAPYCVYINIKGYDTIESCEQDKNIYIYSFKEWCEKFNHKPNFIKKDDKGRVLKVFEIGEWYTQPLFPETLLKNGNRAKYYRVKSCLIEYNVRNNYYYNHINFDQIADENWSTENRLTGQSNTDYDVEMVKVEKHGAYFIGTEKYNNTPNTIKLTDRVEYPLTPKECFINKPENWYVERESTEQIQPVIKYLNNLYNKTYNGMCWRYYGVTSNTPTASDKNDGIFEKAVELTTEQFEEMFLNKPKSESIIQLMAEKQFKYNSTLLKLENLIENNQPIKQKQTINQLLKVKLN